MRRPAVPKASPSPLQSARLGKYMRNSSCSCNCAEACSIGGPALSAAVGPAWKIHEKYQLQLCVVLQHRRPRPLSSSRHHFGNTSCSCSFAQACSIGGPALSAAVGTLVTIVYYRTTGYSILQSTYCIIQTSHYTRLISHSKPQTAHLTLLSLDITLHTAHYTRNAEPCTFHISRYQGSVSLSIPAHYTLSAAHCTMCTPHCTTGREGTIKCQKSQY